MKDEILFSITKVVDDSTGIWSVGELEYSLHMTLDDYIEDHGAEGVAELKRMMKTIEKIIDDKLAEGKPGTEPTAEDEGQVEAQTQSFTPCIIEHQIQLS